MHNTYYLVNDDPPFSSGREYERTLDHNFQPAQRLVYLDVHNDKILKVVFSRSPRVDVRTNMLITNTQEY